MTLQVGDTVRTRWSVLGTGDGIGTVAELHPKRRYVTVDWNNGERQTVDGDALTKVSQPVPTIRQGDDTVADPLVVPLKVAIASLRRALEVAARDASMLRLQALVGLLAHVERCVRELPE